MLRNVLGSNSDAVETSKHVSDSIFFFPSSSPPLSFVFLSFFDSNLKIWTSHFPYAKRCCRKWSNWLHKRIGAYFVSNHRQQWYPGASNFRDVDAIRTKDQSDRPSTCYWITRSISGMEESENFTTKWSHHLDLRDMGLGFLEPFYYSHYRMIDNKLAETSGAFGNWYMGYQPLH